MGCGHNELLGQITKIELIWLLLGMFYKCRLNFRQTGPIFGENAMGTSNLDRETGFPKGSIPVDGLRRQGVNSGMRCPMQTEKRAAVRTKEIESKTNVVASVEFVVRAALHDSVEDDFVHSIAGRIIAEAGKPWRRGRRAN